MSLYPPHGGRQPSVATLAELMAAEARVNKHPYWRFNGWQVYQASEHGRGPDIPPWHFWAAYWDLDEPPVVAASLPELEHKVHARQATLYQRMPIAFRSRRTLAIRQGWPDGVLERCEQLEQIHPAWSVTWRAGTFVGRLDVPFHHCEQSSDDPFELDVMMEEVPEEHDYSLNGCAWCLANKTPRLKL